MLNRGTYETTQQADFGSRVENYQPHTRIIPDSPTLRHSTEPHHVLTPKEKGSVPHHTMADFTSTAHASFSADARTTTVEGAPIDPHYLRGGLPPWQSGVARPTTLHSPTPPSSYTREYGHFRSSPHDHDPTHPAHLNYNAATADLFHGTTKATAHVPNYAGFIPASDQNEYATSQAAGIATRPVNKTDALETHLQDIPGYTGYKPVSVINDRGPKQDNLGATTYSGNFK